MLRLVPLLVLLALPAAVAEASDPVPLDDATTLRITASTTLAPGTYVRPDPEGDGVVVIETDDVVVDLGGATLVGNADPDALPNAYTGIAIHVKNAKNVTIKNGSIRGYKIGIRAEKATKLTLTDIDASHNFRQRLYSTPEREDLRDWLRPHDNDNGEWEAKYGAGFSLNDCEKARVTRCVVRKGQNGLLLTRCKGCSVERNDFSFNSGWGIALYRSSYNVIRLNRCDWCVRGYSHGVYHRGQDSAGILVFEQCTSNEVVANSATHGGDGFFLYAGNETTERTGEGGSNHNTVAFNDFSHAVANGIEATFSRRNTFDDNDVSDSDHGLWLGYSSETKVRRNRAVGCLSAAISIEHGQNNEIASNRIAGGRTGIHLWWDEDPAFVEGVFGKHNDTASSGNEISNNLIVGVDTAIRMHGDTGSEIVLNLIRAERLALGLGADTRLKEMELNRFQGSHGAREDDPTPPILIRNRSGAHFVVSGSNQIRGRFQPVPPAFGARGVTLDDPIPEFQQQEVPIDIHPFMRWPDAPVLPEGHPRGRDQIRIDEWGPLDPTERAVFPKFVRGGSEAKFYVLGSGYFRAIALTPDDALVFVGPASGTAPATLTVRPKGEAGVRGVFPFESAVQWGEFPDAQRVYRVAGVLVATEWDVALFEWTVDPREDEDAFRRLIAGQPKSRFSVPALDFAWRSDAPTGVRANRFATVATTTLPVTKGRYRVRSVSDDGIRVYVNDKRVIDNWTWHAPTEDTAEIDLEAGEITIRVEHFEIDGWAHLEVTLEPLAK